MATSKDTRARRLLGGGLAGLLAGAAAVLASQAVTAFLTGVSSPLLSVANRAVDEAPRPLKEFAIRTFGTADKAVLIGGVIGTVALLAVAIGIVGVRRPRVAAGLFLLLSLVATTAALTDRAATASPLLRLVPALVLVVVGIASLLLLLHPLRTPASSTSPAPATPASSAGVDVVEMSEPGKPRLLVRDLVPSRRDELPPAFDRRALLKAALAVSAIAAAGGVVSRVYGGNDAAASRLAVELPKAASPASAIPKGSELGVEGITPYLTSNADFYRVDNALQVPAVPIEGYTLRIHGMVEKEIELTYQDLLDRNLVEERITLTCVSNPVGGDYLGNATWLGVPMYELLAEAGVQDGADAVKSTSADDFTVGTPLSALTDKKRGALVAVGMNGAPLPLEHGFPVRMVTPGLYGYVSATKWLVDLEVTRFSDFKAYWTTRGYDAKAPIKTSSRIDVPKSFARVKAGKVPVAGLAWAQDRGIEKVEVRVDGGPWQETELAVEDTVNSWRQWVYQWEADSGNHTIEVQATDKTGYTQTAQQASIAPNGSTGLDSVNVTVG